MSENPSFLLLCDDCENATFHFRYDIFKKKILVVCACCERTFLFKQEEIKKLLQGEYTDFRVRLKKNV